MQWRIGLSLHRTDSELHSHGERIKRRVLLNQKQPVRAQSVRQM